MSTARSQTIELRLAEAGTELWPAVEAAQYARLINFDPPARTDQAQAIARFVAAFAACAETWEALEPMARSGALAGLGAQLDALQRCDLFVHWAAIERGIAGSGGSMPMPIAVLTISETDLPTAHLQLPGELEVDPQRGATTH